MKKLLVLRFSAMGDVALTVPAIRAVAHNYPDVQITFVSRPLFAAFFKGIPNLSYFSLNSKHLKGGLPGLIELYSNLKSLSNYDAVIDLHNVFRTKLLSLLFRTQGVPIFTINKEKREKRQLINHKKQCQLKHTVERYCDVFAAAGLPIVPDDDCKIAVDKNLSEQMQGKLNLNSANLNIGIAPFALYQLKTWPMEYMTKLLQMITAKHVNTHFWLFGGREDIEKLNIISQSTNNAVVVAGKFTLEEELAIMSMLDLMVAMDSSNMHMASLVGTKVVSIWGATDPLLGFGAWKNSNEQSIRLSFQELPCRPCTIYGRGKCRTGKFDCMQLLTPERVFENIEHFLKKQ